MTNEKIFHIDEMQLRDVNPDWTPEELLSQDGIFFLKDLMEPLSLTRLQMQKVRQALEKVGKDPWVVMGVRKAWTHWQVRMKVFSPYYKKHLVLPYKPLPEDWNANDLITEGKGVYLLNDVVKIIPFSGHQIRHQVKKNPNAREELGVWKDEKLSLYLVDLAIFGAWLKRVWTGSPDSLGGHE